MAVHKNEQAPVYHWGNSVSIPDSHNRIVQVGEKTKDRQLILTGYGSVVKMFMSVMQVICVEAVWVKT
jgi:hypothetical protein